ncbi:PREDICTED: mucin-5AC-like [Poecilia mexicana]|uniref:mucin-5AC-like n=1 Tax=Poecilia mexicana TaxID=48701 RepID=UPI00072E54BB|nr:PREDICTED: mucin-5AC-like [Poecilia mexicana]
MSTSDAAELELRVAGVGGETTTPQCATARTAWTPTASEHQDNTSADSLGKDKTYHWGHSEVKIQNAAGSILVTSLILRLSKPKLGLEKTLEAWSSLVDPELAEIKNSALQVNGTSSSSSIETTSACPSSEAILFSAKKREKLLNVVNRDLGITGNLNRTHILPNSNTRVNEHNNNDLYGRPCESQSRRCPGSLTGTEKDKKQHQTHLENHSYFGNCSDEPVPMLSSTMVTVLAPQWGGRVRRTKRFDGTGYSEAQADLQEGANTSPNHQQGVKNVLTGGSNIPRRVLGTRSNTVGWSSKSDPSSLDFNTKKDMISTVSLDSGAISPLATSPTSWSHLSPNLNEQRHPQMDLQGRQSSLSTNPATSSFLLSFRRVNPNTTNSSQIPVLPEGKSSSRNCSLNNNEQERPKSVLSPSPVSYRTTETGPVLSPVGSDHRERNVSEKFSFLTSPTSRTMKDNSYTQQSQMTQTSFTSSKPTFQRQQNCENVDNTIPFSESSISPTRYFPLDHSAPSKTHSLPRRANLKSTSWWKQVSQEGSSPLSVKNTNKKDYEKTDSPSLTDNKRLGSYMLNSDNNNTVELARKSNINRSLKMRSPESERTAIQQRGLNGDNRQPQKPQSMPDCRPASKVSTVLAQTTQKQTKVPDKNDERKTLLSARVPSSTSFTPMTSNLPADSFGKYNGSPLKSTSAPTSQNKMDTQKLSKPPLFHSYSSAASNQPYPSQTTYDSSSSSNTKHTLSFQSQQASSNNSVHSSSAQTSTFTSKSNVSPLGFKRSYVCLPKPYHTKPVTSLIPSVNTLNKTRGSYTPATPITSSANTPRSPSTLSPPVASTMTSPIPVSASSLLTPPATPVIASPTSEPSPPKLKSIVYNSLEREPKKHGKRERRVTWQDSVDGQCSESVSVEKPDLPQVQANNSSAPTKLTQSPPSAFSYPQSGSPEGGDHKAFNNTQPGKGGKYRSLSSDCAEVVTRERGVNKQTVGDTMSSDQGVQGPFTTRQERTLSVESGTVQCRHSAPLSLPPDFPSGYKNRYSTPPYSTLMSTRQTKGELKTLPQTFLISQPSHLNHAPQTSSDANLFVSTFKPPLSPVRPSQACLKPFQSGTAKQESSVCSLSDTDRVNNNNLQGLVQYQPNSQLQLFDNRVHITSQSLLGDEEHSFSSTYVTETLVYKIKSKSDVAADTPKDTTPTSSQHNANTLVSVETKFKPQPGSAQSNEVVERSCRHSDQSSSDGRSTKSEPSLEETSDAGADESVLSKSRFYSVEVNNEESPKKSRFGIKRSVSTPSSGLPRSESDRVAKSYNKMDQMFNKLKQKFSSKRTEEDSSFPFKWRRTSQIPSLSGSSDVSSVSEASADSTKTLEERRQEEMVLKDNAVKTEGTKRQTDNRYTLVPARSVGERKPGNDLPIWSEHPTQGNKREDPNSCAAPQSQIHLTVHGPVEKFEMCENSERQHTATSQFLSFSNHSIDGSLSPNFAYPSQSRKSTPSPRSPFSPFSSLSPVSPFSAAEVFEDNVFFSPKLHRRRESSSPFEPVDGIRLGVSRRSRVSTGPPTSSPGKENEPFTSSYADLKYGIEPGRSFSVSSVLSSRPARPGRISTGARFMSVGDLSHPALSPANGGNELHQRSITPAETGPFYTQPEHDPRMSRFPCDAEKMRSRSLPRSLTQCLAKWSSGVPPSQSSTGTPSSAGLLRSPSMNICHFSWDAEGPPTPPPTPPLSPVTRLMSRPTSLPAPTFPSSPEAADPADGQSSRVHRPSRGFVSSLNTFDESSDSNSDTTTDDEYYIDSDGGEKETEL